MQAFINGNPVVNDSGVYLPVLNHYRAISDILADINTAFPSREKKLLVTLADLIYYVLESPQFIERKRAVFYFERVFRLLPQVIREPDCEQYVTQK